VSAESARLTVLVIAADAAARELVPRAVRDDRLLVTDDLAEGLALAESDPPDVAFVEVGMGDGAGLALVHHLKAVVPSVTVYALAAKGALDAAANAVALGGAGLIMLPVGGDEILSAIEAVKQKLADHALRAEAERAALTHARAVGWMGRVAELADSAGRPEAAERLVQVLVEATGATAAAVYLAAGERPTELVRSAASPALDRSAPPLGMEAEILDYARRERLLAVPLATRSFRAGHVLLQQPPVVTGAPRLDGLVKLLAMQAATAFALLAERERTGGAAIKDPASSAYSFAYYVDVAGREIDKARRYGRRFAIATVAFEPVSSGGGKHAPSMSHAEMADQLLKAARDTDVLAHVDEHEFHLLMPETDGVGAHACRRRVLARLADRGRIPRGLHVGVSTFPHDGQNLSQLLRVARRRAEATRYSLVHRLAPEQTALSDLLEAVAWEAEPPPTAVAAARAIELPIADAIALAGMVVSDALRGGSTLVVMAHHERIRLGAAIRVALGPARDNVTVHAIDLRATRSVEAREDLEAFAVLAEHGAYAFLGRADGAVVRGLHAADPLLADMIAERLGRAAGLRLFT
jgi:DNA-binding NarL/FixJ family response regulator/GGDEF domain-containing protein